MARYLKDRALFHCDEQEDCLSMRFEELVTQKELRQARLIREFDFEIVQKVS